ncbi:hypothetical protein [Chryseobacterium carnipullorum]|uniref:hypothetical protein n=1 Tax=Chryseobacterium carnipullorum TaxID=1124835 RepID=UPI000E875167|nr:hypothetical protein [Chryseobacterium carnipullorum]HBV16789.1 hypothetical protein [Chryseobacterium carnipullorum]
MNIMKNAKKLKKADLKNISGGGLNTSGTIENPNLSLCGCSCSGSVTGPWYCAQYIACPQVYTCNQSAI